MMWYCLAEPLSAEYRICRDIRHTKMYQRRKLLLDLDTKWRMWASKCVELDMRTGVN